MKIINRHASGKVRKLICASVSAVGVLALLAATVLYYERNNLVIIAHLGSDNIYDEHNYEILNPFRNRQHERIAEAFLRDFQNHCEKALTAISDELAHIKYTCQREEIHPLISLRLRAKKEESSSDILLRYEVTRYESKGLSKKVNDPFWVRLKKDNNDWRVTNYETWY